MKLLVHSASPVFSHKVAVKTQLVILDFVIKDSRKDSIGFFSNSTIFTRLTVQN